MRHPFIAILAVMGFLCAAILGFAPTTRAGVQCPTAPVQTVAVRDCCGRVVQRAPEPGDRAFLQCRCAEKKSATQKATASTKVDFWLASGEPTVVASAPQAIWRPFAYAAGEADWCAPPGLRPPVLS